MRKLTRRPLSREIQTLLQTLTLEVCAQVDTAARAAKAKSLWKNKDAATFQKIRRKLQAMASGRERCMYCEDNLGTDIEHFRPQTSYPEYAFDWFNYLLACSHCNSNEKRTKFPLDGNGQPLLIDPTVDDPGAHLVLSPTTGKLRPLTPKGTESILVFGLSRAELAKGRMDVWYGLVSWLIPEYAQARRQGDNKKAQKTLDRIGRVSFSSVLWHLLRVAKTPSAAKALRAHPECLAALREFGDELAHAAGFMQ